MLQKNVIVQKNIKYNEEKYQIQSRKNMKSFAEKYEIQCRKNIRYHTEKYEKMCRKLPNMLQKNVIVQKNMKYNQERILDIVQKKYEILCRKIWIIVEKNIQYSAEKILNIVQKKY